MIEDKKKGLVIAESPLEEGFYNMKYGAEESIKMLKLRIKNAQDDLKKSQRFVYQKFREGAQKAIKQFEVQIKINEEIAKFADSKLKKEKV